MDATAVVLPPPAPPAEVATTASPPPSSQDGAETAGFASALESQLALATPEASVPVVPTVPLIEDEPAAAVSGEPQEALAADSLLALLASPFILAASPAPMPPPPVTNPAGLDSTTPAAPGSHESSPVGASARGEAKDAGLFNGSNFMPTAGPAQMPTTPDTYDIAAASVKEEPLAALPQADAPSINPNIPAPGTPAASAADFRFAVASAPEPQIAARVGSAAWNDGLAQQVTVMVKDGGETAHLRLDPPELGPLEVRLSMDAGDDGIAHVQFISAHAAVRDALEAALPQLRDVLAGSGITLGEASVGEGQSRDAQQPPRRNAAASGLAADDMTPAAPRMAHRPGLIDTFA